jgi:hypothetical protein
MLETEARAIRNSILALANVNTAFAWRGITKVFAIDVTPDVPLPYIVFKPVIQGFENPNRNMSESIWEVAVHTEDIEFGMQWAERISRLHNTYPVLTGVTSACVAGYLQIEYNVSRRFVQQNHTYFVLGYHFCLPLEYKE